MNFRKGKGVKLKCDASILDYLFILRPTLFFPVWTVFLAGYFAHDHHANFAKSPIFALFSNWPLIEWHQLSVGGILTLLLGGVFIINQIADVENDRQNNKLFLIANGYISIKNVAWEAGFLIGISLVAALFHSMIHGLLFLILFIVSGIFYSIKPFSWKDRPILGLVTNAAAGLLVFLIGWAVYDSIILNSVYYAIPYVLAISSVYLYTTLPDVEGDQSTGKITFGVKYGFKATTISALILEFSSCLISFWLRDWVIFFPAIISLPLFVLVVIRQQMKDVFKAIKLPIFFLSMTICCKCPIYLLFVLLIFFFSRWYYRRRFNLNYPSFSV